MEQDVWQYYQANYPGQVQVLGPDCWNGTVSQVQSFKTQTGATYPLLLNGTTATGGNLYTLYGTYDNYIVINKQGIVRYHAADHWLHGNRYHLNEIRGCVDSLVTSPVGVFDPPPRAFRLTASPNPFRGSLAIELAQPLADRAAARVTVVDLAGRLVATLWEGPSPAGMVRVNWDGRDQTGGAMAPGLYVVRAEVGKAVLSRRVAFLR